MNQQNYQDAQVYIEKLRGFTAQLAAELGQAPKCFVLTFGCQQNEADSEKLAGMAQDMGYELCADPAEADLIAVNTCAIREHAEQKALSIVGQYKHLKAKKPSLIIAVCGCMVAQEHRREDIKHKYPYVDLTFGTASLHRFPELLWQKIARSRRIFCPEETEYVVAEGMPITRTSDYRAWVSVMYGCNNFCSYCIVPYVRGRERSREKAEVVAEVKDLVARGYKDITLLGQNVNSYAKGMGYVAISENSAEGSCFVTLTDANRTGRSRRTTSCCGSCGASMKRSQRRSRIRCLPLRKLWKRCGGIC